jgi:hypothetical protein
MDYVKDYLRENSERMKIADCLAVIMDRSEMGRDALASALKDYPELERMNVIGGDLKWEFMVSLISKRKGGVLVVYAQTRDSLAGTLDIVSRKVVELGDRFCAYLPAVADESLPFVMAAIASLQQTPSDRPS